MCRFTLFDPSLGALITYRQTLTFSDLSATRRAFDGLMTSSARTILTKCLQTGRNLNLSRVAGCCSLPWTPLDPELGILHRGHVTRVRGDRRPLLQVVCWGTRWALHPSPPHPHHDSQANTRGSRFYGLRVENINNDK